MNTINMLIAHFGGSPIIPVENAEVKVTPAAEIEDDVISNVVDSVDVTDDARVIRTP